jgi:hypothetical protein
MGEKSLASFQTTMLSPTNIPLGWAIYRNGIEEFDRILKEGKIG